MKITMHTVAASFEVAINCDNNMAPTAANVGEQLQTVITEAVRAWQEKLRGTVMVGSVRVNATQVPEQAT